MATTAFCSDTLSGLRLVVLSICGNSFKNVGKAFLMKLVERMPRVFKAVVKAKGGYF